MCALAVIARGETYGYAIASELAAAGLGVVKGGTLYPLLARFEQAGLVRVEWRAGESGPGRKYYALTDAGLLELDRRRVQWRAFAHTVTAITNEKERVHD
jgi:PadR family transcriptional regulator PadR